MNKKINEKILLWYSENKRDLAWRKNCDAYRVWVSEIMLQQTRVEAVKVYYERFMKQIPTIQDLALIEDDKLSKLWEGLGYYSRVRNMKKAAIICCEQYGGNLPSTYEELLELAGIGPYTAGAIASIAFQQQRCAIDGNVLRVFSRLLCIEKDIMMNETKKEIQTYIEKDMPLNMGDFNQAIMDFGSSICIANGALRCNICPLIKECKGYKKGVANTLPIRKKKKERKKEKYTVLIYTYQDRVLIHKRESTGLLASLYEFELVPNHFNKKDFKNALFLGKYKHLFSHIEWDMKGFLIEVKEPFVKENYKWVKISELENIYSIPSAYRKYKEKLFEYYK